MPSSCCSQVVIICYRLSLLDLVAKAEALQQEHPVYPAVASLQRFSMQLQRHTRHILFKKWFPRFFVLNGGRLYFSDGKNAHPDSREGTAAFARSSPAPDGRYCVDMRGWLVWARGCCCCCVLDLTGVCRLQRCSVQRGGRRAGVCLRDQVPFRRQGA